MLQSAKSIRCNDCGKLFTASTELECHAVQSGHKNFSESTEEKRPLTEEEKLEQLQKIEAKLKQRRLEREAREKQESLDRERNRIRSGKEMIEAKRKHEEAEMKKVMDQRRKDKAEDKLARERIKQQIEQDKLARKQKFGEAVQEDAQPQQSPETSPSKPAIQQNYSAVKLQIKLSDGKTLVQTFGAKEPLSAVRVYVELNRTDGKAPFTLVDSSSFPKKTFGTDDYDKPLELLGNKTKTLELPTVCLNCWCFFCFRVSAHCHTTCK